MKIIGLTGSIGMGKSTAARLLRGLKIPVFDSDACVHRLLRTDRNVLFEIGRRFPAALDVKAGSVNRQKLGEIVFADSHKRAELEGILHPLVQQEQKKFILAARRAGYKKVVLDIPLLYETEAEKRCHSVLCVTAPDFVQRQRVLGRPWMNESKFGAVLRQQMPDKEKLKRADFVIPTGLGHAVTLKYLKKALRCLSLSEE